MLICPILFFFFVFFSSFFPMKMRLKWHLCPFACFLFSRCGNGVRDNGGKRCTVFEPFLFSGLPKSTQVCAGKYMWVRYRGVVFVRSIIEVSLTFFLVKVDFNCWLFLRRTAYSKHRSKSFFLYKSKTWNDIIQDITINNLSHWYYGMPKNMIQNRKSEFLD